MSVEKELREPPLESDFVDEFAEPKGAVPVTRRRRFGRRPSLFGPLLLIGVGLVFLLDQFGYLPIDPWILLWRFWPVILVLVGLDLLLGRRSFIGSMLGALLPLLLIGGLIAFLFFGRDLSGWLSWTGDNELKRETIEHPLGEIQEADVTLNMGSWHTSVAALDDSPNLIQGEIDTYGELRFLVDEGSERAEVTLSVENPGASGLFDWASRGNDRWEIELSPNLPLDLELDCGSGSGEFDLNELQVRDLLVDGGSGSIELTLPAEWGMEVELDVGSGSVELVLPERGEATVDIDGGTGRIQIVLPAKMAARVEIVSGSGSFRPGERLKLVQGERDGDGVWETEGFQSAENRIELKIDQGSGAITFE